MSDQVLSATVADLPAPKAAARAPSGSSISPQARLVVLAGMVLVGVVYLVASVFPGRVPYLRSEGSVDASANAVAMHCERFIEIARAHYGSNWKYRLDPADGLCAQQVQQEWERQWGVPGAPGAEAPPPIKSVSDDIAPPPSAPAAETIVPASSPPATSCLNIISLAKTRYGTEWRTNIDAGIQAQCAGEISRMAP
jgi:hypothetical protein